MPKLKTNKGAAKRFRRTGGGKLRRNRAFRRHILTKKASKRKRELRPPALVDAADAGHVKRLLPYG
ncbi:MAG: 50S ribosomal protein L35 [Nitrospinota bacterium]